MLRKQKHRLVTPKVKHTKLLVKQQMTSSENDNLWKKFDSWQIYQSQCDFINE